MTPALSSANPRLCWVHARVKKGYFFFPKREPNPQTRVLCNGRRCHCRLSIVQGQGSGQFLCHCRFLESVLHTLAGLLLFSGSLHDFIKTPPPPRPPVPVSERAFTSNHPLPRLLFSSYLRRPQMSRAWAELRNAARGCCLWEPTI